MSTQLVTIVAMLNAARMEVAVPDQGEGERERQRERGDVDSDSTEARSRVREIEQTRKHAKGRKRRQTEIKCDALLDEQEGRLIVHTRGTYKLCPGLYSTGDDGDLGERRAGESVVITQDAQGE